MESILRDIYSAFKDRLSNRFITAFVISWIVVNWQPIAIIYHAGDNMISTIDYVINHYNNWLYLFLFPVLSALAFTISLHYVFGAIEIYGNEGRLWRHSIKMFKLTEEAKQKTEYVRAEFELEKLKSGIEEVEELNQRLKVLNEDKTQIERNRNKLELDLRDKNEELIEARKRVKDLETALSALQDDVNEVSDEEVKEYDSAYKSLHNSNLRRYFIDAASAIVKKEKFPFEDVMIVEKLKLQDLIIQIGGSMKLTRKGRYIFRRFVEDFQPSEVDDLPF